MHRPDPANRPGSARPFRGGLILIWVGLVVLVTAGPLAVAGRAALFPSTGAVHQQTADPQLPGPASDPSGGKDEARRILSGKDYQERAEPRTVAERIRDWIRDHLPMVKGPSGQRRTPTWVSFGIVGVMLVGALGAIAWGLAHVRRARRLSTDDADAEGGDVEVTPLLTVDEWKAEAERLEAAAQWREALRARYRSLVGNLIDDGFLADLPGRTPGEYRVELTEAVAPAAHPFATATTMFEVAWYGHQPTTGDDLDRFRVLAAEVRDEAARVKPAPVGSLASGAEGGTIKESVESGAER